MQSSRPLLADSHVHLHAYPDVDGLLDRANAAGVSLVVGVGIDLATSQATVDIARRRSGVVAAVGFHPAYLREPVSPTSLAALEKLAQNPSVGFLGEIGIDTVDGTGSISVQLAVLREELAIARRVGKPVNLHLRGSLETALQLLDETHAGDFGALFHYFTGGPGLAQRAIDAGLYLSVGKPVTRPANLELREAIQAVPLDRLLLETDSYPLPGRQTEPSDVRGVAQAIAQLRGQTVAEVGEQTTATLLRLIGRG